MMSNMPRSRPASGPADGPAAAAPVAELAAAAELSLPLRQFTMVPGQNIDALFLCPLCHDSWADPVELVPCGDIFCKRCIDAARAQHAAQPMIMENFQCPLCQTVVQGEKKPNRMLLNSVLTIEVECRFCQWRGTREASEQQAHTCTAGNRILKPARHESGAASALEGAGTSGGDGGATSVTARSDVGLAEGTSTAPAPSKALPTRRSGPMGSTSTAPSTPSAAAAAAASSSTPSPPAPPQPRPGPRRAQREIENGYVPIGDDPISAAPRLARTSLSRDSTADGGVGGGGRTSSHDFAMGDANASGVAGLYDSGARSANSPLQPGGGGGSAQATPNRSHGASGNSSSGPSSKPQEPWRRYGLTQIEYDQLVGIFMMFDDGTGQLWRGQLRALCFCMNFVQHEEDVDVIFASMDQGGKGYVSQDDFLRWLSTHRPDPAALFGLSQFEYTDAILQFRSVDPEYNGVIDLNAFTTLCIANSYAQTREQATQYFRMCDERHTGYISLQQFLQNLKFMKTGRDAPHTTAATSYGAGSSSGYAPGAHTLAGAAPRTSLTSSGTPGLGMGGGGGPVRSFAGSTMSGSPQVSDFFYAEPGQPQPPPPQQQQLATSSPNFRGPAHGAQPYPAPNPTAPPPNPPRRPPAPRQHQQQSQGPLDNAAGSRGVPSSAVSGRTRTGPSASSGSMVTTPISVPPTPPQRQQQQQSARLHRQGGRGNRGDEECAVM